MKPDLSQLSIAELNAVIAEAERLISARKDEELQKTYQEFAEKIKIFKAMTLNIYGEETYINSVNNLNTIMKNQKTREEGTTLSAERRRIYKAFNRCINNNKETPKTAEDIKNTTSVFLILVNLAKKTENKSINTTINSCPISNPKLNDSKGKATLSSFPNIDLSK